MLCPLSRNLLYWKPIGALSDIVNKASHVCIKSLKANNVVASISVSEIRVYMIPSCHTTSKAFRQSMKLWNYIHLRNKYFILG
mgnify:CR=1 FL=1